MPLSVAIQMDPIEGINIDADSSFALALEAQKRGAQLFHYLPSALALEDGRVTARARPLAVKREKGNHARLGAYEKLDLASVDVILMRQDPPFDMAYITATHVLEHVRERVLVVNDPVAVRNAPEKLFVTHFDGVMPPTLITSDRLAIEAFRAEHKDLIVKPLYGNGGADIFHLTPEDENAGALFELFTRLFREPIVVQKYLKEVRAGDKRIILIDGEPAGALNRIPAKGEARANLHVGGRAEKTALTSREREICDIIGPRLKAQGIVFAGIDVIGGYLTEINVTSPTGIQEIGRFDGTDLAALIWDAILARLTARRARPKS